MMSTFYNLPTGILENETLRLEYLTTAGPRIVRFSRPGEPNLLAELPDVHIKTPLGPYYFRGGHRLWSAPEAIPDTYTPDNDGVKVEEFPGGVRLIGRSEPSTGTTKIIEICLSPDRAAVTLRHELRNSGLRPVDLAPWALTMLRLGGMAILPQPAGNADALGLLHNRILALWPYTRINDPRLILGDDFILNRASPGLSPVKIGYFNPYGWLAYWVDGSLFRKTFDSVAIATYPDSGCNAEIFCDDNVVELETLGPLGRLEPGESSFHTETWEIYDSLDQAFIPPVLRERLEKITSSVS